MKNNQINKFKLVGIAFISYIFIVYLLFSFTFTLNKNYYNSNENIATKENTNEKDNTTNKESQNNTVTSTNVVENKNENGIDISKLSKKVNSGTNISEVLTDDEVVASLQSKNDKDVKYILENREALSMNYLRLLNANSDSKFFIKDVLQNNRPLSFEGESVSFSRNIPYFLQWDRRWGNTEYADGNLGINGCGPTCLAMVVSGLNKDVDINPVSLSKFQDQKYIQSGGTTWDYFREVPNNYGIKVKELSTDKNIYFNELKNGRPIIVNVKAGDFTSMGHYIVLVGVENDYIVINDPNSPDNSNEKWTFERLAPQIKNGWSFSKERQ